MEPPKMCTTSGEPVDEVRRQQAKQGNEGQHKSYIVLCEEERKKGWVRPYRTSYRHNVCGTITNMGPALAETYARDPFFYSHTFCVECNKHFPVAEFTWVTNGETVGS